MLLVTAVDVEDELKCSPASRGAYHPVHSNCQSFAIRLVILIAGTARLDTCEDLLVIIRLTRYSYEIGRHLSSPVYWKELRYFAKAWPSASVAWFNGNALRVRQDPLSLCQSMKSTASFVQRLKILIRKAIEIAKNDIRKASPRARMALLYQLLEGMNSISPRSVGMVSTYLALTVGRN